VTCVFVSRRRNWRRKAGVDGKVGRLVRKRELRDTAPRCRPRGRSPGNAAVLAIRRSSRQNRERVWPRLFRESHGLRLDRERPGQGRRRLTGPQRIRGGRKPRADRMFHIVFGTADQLREISHRSRPRSACRRAKRSCAGDFSLIFQRQRDAKIVRRLRKTSITLEAPGAEYGLTRRRSGSPSPRVSPGKADGVPI
jgi:hypothetical protein